MSTITADSVWAVVLAAGTSSRLGQPKQLLDLGGEPILNHVLRAAAISRVAGMVLVLGHEATAISGGIGDFGQHTVVNANYADGQSTSLKVGIAALPAQAAAAVILLGDQPLVTSALIDHLIGRFIAENCMTKIVQARYGRISAPPVLIGRGWFAGLYGLTGDHGARELIRDHRDQVRFVESDQDRPFDIDTLDDYTELLRRAGGGGIPVFGIPPGQKTL